MAIEQDEERTRYVLTAAKLGTGDTMALKLLLKRLIASSDPGMPDLWSPR